MNRNNDEMIKITYAVTEEKHSVGGKRRTSYGLVTYSTMEDGSETIVASVHDITSDKVGLTKLVNNCNRLKLSIIHLNDVVEDFLVK